MKRNGNGRTTIAIEPDQRRRLAELAAQRHERGISGLIREAIEAFLAASHDERAKREELLALGGSLSKEEGDRLRESVERSRAGWRR